jgi:phage I-like protein
VVKLTREEVAVAKKMGISTEAYARQKKMLNK